MKDKKILVVEDDKIDRDAIVTQLEELNIPRKNIIVTDNKEAAFKALEKDSFALATVDLELPESTRHQARNINAGIEIIKEIKHRDKYTHIIVLTDHLETKLFMQALEAGRDDYLFKKYLNTEELSFRVTKALHTYDLRLRNAPKLITFNDIIGNEEAVKLAEKAAEYDMTVLITGETGTGKELLAQAIHSASSRAKSKFVPVEINTLNELTIESELFGHVKGAFTGAIADKRGFFEAAEHGTIFLDEIGEISKEIQVKLLRVLESRVFYRVGATEPKESECRVIAATNKDLETAVQKEAFRQDLFYRLNIFRIHVKPLRDRVEDIPGLVSLFIQELASKQSYFQNLTISPDALVLLKQYNWPGNVRQLKTMIERCALLAQNQDITRDEVLYELQKEDKNFSTDSFISTNQIDKETKAVLLALEQITLNKQEQVSPSDISKAMKQLISKEKLPNTKKIGSIIRNEFQIKGKRGGVYGRRLYEITHEMVAQRLKHYGIHF